MKRKQALDDEERISPYDLGQIAEVARRRRERPERINPYDLEDVAAAQQGKQRKDDEEEGAQ